MKKYVCTVCGYIVEGEIPAQPRLQGSCFRFCGEDRQHLRHRACRGHRQGRGHSAGDRGRPARKLEGECSEVGMYLAMARVAEREGYPRSLRLTSAMPTRKQTTHPALQSCWRSCHRQHQEEPDDACRGRVRRMCRQDGSGQEGKGPESGCHPRHRSRDGSDEARHGRGFEGLLKRYFNTEV